jgi:hypothetical protein
MFSRLGRWFQRVEQWVMFSAPITVPLSIYALKKKQESDRYQVAYQIIEARIKKRSSHEMMSSVFNATPSTRIVGNNDTLKNKRTSIEPISQINAFNTGAPVIWNKDGSQSELNALSLEDWPDFLETLSGRVFVTFGFRKALAATNPVQFTHAVVYVHDAQGNHAFFGYYKEGSEAAAVGIKANPIINDGNHKTILPVYTLHDELTIAGDKTQAKQLFEIMDSHARVRFTGWTMNCYTPLVSALIQAESLGFVVPEVYRESLLITVPSERNYGAGITPNKKLAPIAVEFVEENQILQSVTKRRT